MHIDKTNLSNTRIKVTIKADQPTLDEIKQNVLRRLNATVKLQGFRSGKAPLTLVEKQLDSSVLQSEFLDDAVNRLYSEAVTEKQLRPVDRPSVTISKFVPFTTLEVVIEVDAVGDITLPDYKKVKLAPKKVSITAKDVDEVIENLLVRAADKKPVERAAKEGDEVVIDFTGVDTKTKEPVAGADGKDYPLVLGSNTFIPGFEPNLIGMKPKEDKSFDIVFPKDYGVAALQAKKVTFSVVIQSVNAIEKPKVDDAFAAKVGPFKTLAELRENIKQQVTDERQTQAQRDYENELLETIAAKAKVAIPDSLVEEELERLENDERQNLVYRGQTWQEHLDAEGITEEQHKDKNRGPAAERVKAGLVLSEIAAAEKIDVSKEEIDMRLQLLKGQYKDPQMLAEIDKPDNRRDIASRILTEKTIEKLVNYAKKTS
jgi:trigger factor